MICVALAAAIFVAAQTPPVPVAPPGVPADRAVDPRPDIRAGRVEEFRIPARGCPDPRRIWVYTPPGYSPSLGGGYGLIVAFDGEEYLNEIPLPMILDVLLSEGKAPPFVAVLVDNGSGAARLDDLANHERFAALLGDEVLPWVRTHWDVTRDPQRTIVTGSSAGGLAAAYVAFKRPDLFGRVLSQSGAFWRGNEGSNGAPYEWLTKQYASSARKDLHFFLDVGSLESAGAMGGAAPSILAANRHLRDALVAKGYAVSYTEVPDGAHAPPSWRLRLPEGIVALAAPVPASR